MLGRLADAQFQKAISRLVKDKREVICCQSCDKIFSDSPLGNLLSAFQEFQNHKPSSDGDRGFPLWYIEAARHMLDNEGHHIVVLHIDKDGNKLVIYDFSAMWQENIVMYGATPEKMKAYLDRQEQFTLVRMERRGNQL